MVRSRLVAAYAQGMTWDAVGTKFGVSGIMAYRVAVRGYRSADIYRRIRRAMAYDYDAWLDAHRAEIERIVAWAEIQPDERTQEFS